MKELDYARWLRDEHDKVEELMADMRNRIAVIPRGGRDRWLDELRARFAHIRAHLTQHMALEEKDGYLAPVVERRPTLFATVERLKQEHRQVAKILDGIHHTLAELAPADLLLTRDCCSRIENLMRYVESHEADENLIVQSVFTDDIGTKD